MPRVTCTSTCSPDGLKQLLQPRQDVVVEEFDPAGGGPGDAGHGGHDGDQDAGRDTGEDVNHVGGRDAGPGDGQDAGRGDGQGDAGIAAPPDAVFRAVDGPFRHYRRTVHILGHGSHADMLRRRIARGVPAPARPWLLEPLVERALRSSGTGRGEGSFLVRQRITWQLSVPVWSWFLTPLVRRELRRPRTDGRQPFWAPAERLDPRSGQVLGLLCLLSVVAGYLGTLLSQTITFAFDEFGAGVATQANTLTAVRVGVLLALALVALADRHGRRPMLLFAATAGCLVAAAGAASVGVWSYGASQTVSRSLSTAMLVLLLVVAAEEVPAGARAYAVSMLTLAAGLGSGMVVWLLPLADLGLRAWRILFLAPLLALPLVLFCSRRLTESRRFTRAPAGSGDPQHDHREPGDLQSGDAERGHRHGSDQHGSDQHGGDRRQGAVPTGTPPGRGAGETSRQARRAKRLTLLGIGALMFSMFAAPASQYLNEFLRTERSFSAGEISVFQLSINTPAAIGVLIGGRFSDARGRRRIGAVGLLGGATFTVLRYGQAGWPMWMWGVLAGIFGAASVPVMGAFGAELFGTGDRARSNGQITVLGVIGSVIGLQIVGRFVDAGGEFWHVFVMVAGAPLLLALLVLVAFPETAWRELEDLNPEDVERLDPAPPPAAPS